MAIVISDNMVLGQAGVLPLSHPRILYDNVLARGTLLASSEVAGFEAPNAIDGFDWDHWQPSAMPARLEVQLSAATEVDYGFLAGHTLGTSQSIVKIQQFIAGAQSSDGESESEGASEGESEGGAWVDLTQEFAPGNDRVLAFLFDPTIGNRFAFYFDGPVAPFIGVAMLGKALAVQRRLYKGHTPITMSRRTVFERNVSERNKTLGNSIVREGVATQIALRNLTSAWVRTHFDPFILAARRGPFGWLWRPDQFPAEAALCWALADIVPTNTGPRDFMSVTFDVGGVIE